MSTLVLHLPLARNGGATEYRYTLSADGHQATRHGTAAASTLPAVGRASEIVA
ncbi:MAG TPA: general secretion pathway protein GspL, partial [Giesbergeria sp.]|nr:general secretion pathway protein GspL [Giesbergeria sp.]